MEDLLKMQKGEITEYYVYSALAKTTKNNKKILEKIASDELGHYHKLKEITKTEASPRQSHVWLYTNMAKLLGLSFTLKFMERNEQNAQNNYGALLKKYPALHDILKDEEEHETKILDMISEERLDYASSIILGLNDALVELTGALSGLTLAFQNGKVIVISGMLIGVAAALSMAASGYLSAKEESTKKSPFRSAIYTGSAYLLTVFLLVLPYLFIPNVYVALVAMMSTAILIIAAYTFYMTTAKNQKFMPRFIEMASISLVVAGISFVMGFVAKTYFGVDI